MNDQQLLRYSRQIMLPDFDYQGQQALLHARVLIVGAGGLGSAASLYLAAAGIGHIVLVDDDVVEFSNLQRQIAHAEKRVHQGKVYSAAASIQSLNSEVMVTCIYDRLNDERLAQQVNAADVVVDCSDNQGTRLQLNQACWHAQTPLVSGAAIRFEGQLSVFDGRQNSQACYACLYLDTDAHNDNATCAANGVIAPVVGVIGSMQAMETIKLIANIGEATTGKLLMYDGMAATWRSFCIPKRQDCTVCGGKA